MGSHDRAVDHVHLPVDGTLLILLLLNLSEQVCPYALVLPAGEAGTHGLPVAVPFRKITPGASGSLDPEDAVEDRAVIQRGTTSSRTLWGEQWGQLAPLLIGQFIAPNHTPFWRISGLCGQTLEAWLPPFPLPVPMPVLCRVVLTLISQGSQKPRTTLYSAADRR